MKQLLSLFASATTNEHFESFLEYESIAMCNTGNAKFDLDKMNEYLIDWVNSVLPPSIEVHEWQIIYVWEIEYHFTQKQIVELVVKIIDGKNKHVDADSYYADAVKLISEASDDD